MWKHYYLQINTKKKSTHNIGVTKKDGGNFYNHPRLFLLKASILLIRIFSRNDLFTCCDRYIGRKEPSIVAIYWHFMTVLIFASGISTSLVISVILVRQVFLSNT